MGIEMTISTICARHNENNKYTMTLTEVASISDYELIEELQLIASRDCWHLEGECGAEFEILGSTLNKHFEEIESVNKGLEPFVDDDYYRCSYMQ